MHKGRAFKAEQYPSSSTDKQNVMDVTFTGAVVLLEMTSRIPFALAGLFSFDPTASKACSICGANFECPGGDVVWPDPRYWHSAPYSIQMHR